MKLWLQFVEDTEARIPVIEHITSAIAPQLRKKWPTISPQWAARVGVSLVAAAVTLVLIVLARWRYGHDDWLEPGCGRSDCTRRAHCRARCRYSLLP